MSDLASQAIVEAAEDGALRLVCERADHFIATIDPGDSMSSLVELVEQHDCTDDEPAHYPIFGTPSHERDFLSRIPEAEIATRPNRPERLCIDHSRAAVGGPKSRCPECLGTAPNASEANHG